jgi:hypothetical protein
MNSCTRNLEIRDTGHRRSANQVETDQAGLLRPDRQEQTGCTLSQGMAADITCVPCDGTPVDLRSTPPQRYDRCSSTLETRALAVFFGQSHLWKRCLGTGRSVGIGSSFSAGRRCTHARFVTCTFSHQQ